MTPTLTIIVGSAAWLTGMVFAWAFVHGAQILRREEAAQMAREAVAPEELAAIQPMAPETARLPAAA